MEKRVIAVFGIVLILAFIGIKLSGFAVNTFSRVSVDPGIRVIANEFDGNTADFIQMNDSEIENIANLTIEREGYGKIVFAEDVNLSEDSENNGIDLDSNIEISANKIEINTLELTSLEKPAVLSLYGLSFSNPRILRNGEVCSSCKKLSYSSGILVFSTSSFSLYSAEETPTSASPAPENRQTGGGSGGISIISNFSLDKDLIKISIKQGESKREIIEIVNTGNSNLAINITPELINRLAISETSFVLKVGERKLIYIDFFAKDEEIPEVYTGRIIFESGSIKRTANIIMEVKEKKPLFDIKVDLKDSLINPEEQIKAGIKIVNMGDLKNIDILLYYAIKDFGGNILAFKEESIAIQEALDIERSFALKLEQGEYIFYAKVSYKNITAASSDAFKVSAKELAYKDKIKIISGLTLIILIIAVISLASHRKRNKKKH